MPDSFVSGQWTSKNSWQVDEIESFNTEIGELIQRFEKKECKIDLTGVIFPGEFILHEIINKKELSEQLIISGAHFAGEVQIINFSLMNILAINSHFSKGANFDKTRFRKVAIFRESNFHINASFIGCIFEEMAGFERAQFQ